jgi:hypothetical protein
MADDQGPVAPNIPDPGTLSGILASQGTPDPQQPQDATQNPIPQINQSVDVNAPQGTEPQLDPRGPEGTIPQAEQEPLPTFEQHYKTAGNILDKVATMIAGDEAWKVRKDTAGNVTVERDPATRGEKWGRIAAAAIGGAIKGMGAGQGPGGGAKALAAGGNFGMQIPAQQKQNADQAASAEQERVMANANNALLHQKQMQGVIALREAGIKLNKDESDLMNNVGDATKNAQSTTLIATAKDMNDIISHHQGNPDLVKYLNGDPNYKTFPTIDGSGNPSLSLYKIDPGLAGRKNEKPYMMPKLAVNPDGSPGLDYDQVEANTQPLGELDSAARGVLAQYFPLKSAYVKATADADKKEQGYIPKTPEESAALSALAKTPEAKAIFDKLSKTQQQMILQQRAAGRTPSANNTPSAPQAISNWGDLLSDPRSGINLAQVKPVDRPAVIADMKARGLTMSKPLTAREIDRSDLAKNSLGNLASAEEIWQRRPDLFGPAGYGKSKMQQAIAGGDPDALAFQTAVNLANLPAVGIHGVKGKWALEDLSKYDSNLWLNHDSMGRVLGEIHRSVKGFALAGGRDIPGTAPEAGGGTQQPGQQPTQQQGQQGQQGQPASIAKDPSWASDGKGNYTHWNGTAWVKATPPTS